MLKQAVAPSIVYWRNKATHSNVEGAIFRDRQRIVFALKYTIAQDAAWKRVAFFRTNVLVVFDGIESAQGLTADGIANDWRHSLWVCGIASKRGMSSDAKEQALASSARNCGRIDRGNSGI